MLLEYPEEHDPGHGDHDDQDDGADLGLALRTDAAGCLFFHIMLLAEWAGRG